MLKIGITGQAGFIGKHIYNTLGLTPEKYERIDFKKEYFDIENDLDAFVCSCDVIIHLAAMNRHNDANIIYNTNIELVQKLIASLERTNSKPHILFSSSTQEEKENMYGKSKKDGREIFQSWANKTGAEFTACIIPNVFGSFGLPFYNSVVATFCYQLCNSDEPKIKVDGLLNLIFVGDLVNELIRVLNGEKNEDIQNNIYRIKSTDEIKVSTLCNLLIGYRDSYFKQGVIPSFKNRFELNLFNTFRSYMPFKSLYPNKYEVHSDNRGNFAEVIRLGMGGQVSFSTTFPGITRGNHFHTRKIERFSVIRGKAKIQLRKIGTVEVLEFYLDGEEPSYVDMPIWYTHNINNIGTEELITIFWINEFYDQTDPDTYFENV